MDKESLAITSGPASGAVMAGSTGLSGNSGSLEGREVCPLTPTTHATTEETVSLTFTNCPVPKTTYFVVNPQDTCETLIDRYVRDFWRLVNTSDYRKDSVEKRHIHLKEAVKRYYGHETGRDIALDERIYPGGECRNFIVEIDKIESIVERDVRCKCEKTAVEVASDAYWSVGSANIEKQRDPRQCVFVDSYIDKLFCPTGKCSAERDQMDCSDKPPLVSREDAEKILRERSVCSLTSETDLIRKMTIIFSFTNMENRLLCDEVNPQDNCGTLVERALCYYEFFTGDRLGPNRIRLSADCDKIDMDKPISDLRKCRYVYVQLVRG